MQKLHPAALTTKQIKGIQTIQRGHCYQIDVLKLWKIIFN